MVVFDQVRKARGPRTNPGWAGVHTHLRFQKRQIPPLRAPSESPAIASYLKLVNAPMVANPTGLHDVPNRQIQNPVVVPDEWVDCDEVIEP